MKFSLEISNAKKSQTCFGVPIFGVISLIGGILVMLTLGAFYSFGNIMTYMTSYMRNESSPNITYSDFIIVQSTFGMTQGITMPILGYLNLWIGEKMSILLGGTIYSLGCILTYFTIHEQLWMVALTYGFISSIGQNLALIPTITTAIKWFPKNKGLAAGVIVSGYGGGSFIFNQVQTRFINPENFNIESSGVNEGYFTNNTLLDRLPSLLLLLGGIYFFMSLFGGLLMVQPSVEWYSDIDETSETTDFSSWRCILKRKEFYLLWISRFSLPLFTQVVGGFYKTFGLTFIYDDHFLSLVGTINSLFNCTGRLFYGFLMDRLTYKVAMSIEAISLMVLTSTLYCTSLVSGQSVGYCDEMKANLTSFESNFTTFDNITDLSGEDICGHPETTSLASKVLFSLWVWAIFFTFPGTYAMQPAVCTQTFGQKYGGMAYSLLFTADIFSNLLVAMTSKPLIEKTGFLGLFLSTSAFGILALIVTLMYPKYPSEKRTSRKGSDSKSMESNG
eukprot:TRINITY_DN3001_c0_g1_i1.p1 TRINITY_DN3001_c0_g1~~TRINITY_DN3001_c0_g1_i1.p1  ORF type:complete len:504 (-),score=64.37 TRINITY_DN3001_c0_g1_i1:149-1660(-)